MLRYLGCLMILGGGAAAELLHARAGLRELNVLSALCHTLSCMESEIRLKQTPLPRLLKEQAGRNQADVSGFLYSIAEAAAGDGFLPSLWRQACEALPLGGYERNVLGGLGDKLSGDEESLCQAIALTRERLQAAYEERRRTRAETERRSAALYLSASAFLVILLL